MKIIRVKAQEIRLPNQVIMTPLRNLYRVAMVASTHAPIPQLKIVSREKAQKWKEIFPLATLTSLVLAQSEILATGIRRDSLEVENDRVK